MTIDISDIIYNFLPNVILLFGWLPILNPNLLRMLLFDLIILLECQIFMRRITVRCISLRVVDHLAGITVIGDGVRGFVHDGNYLVVLLCNLAQLLFLVGLKLARHSNIHIYMFIFILV